VPLFLSTKKDVTRQISTKATQIKVLISKFTFDLFPWSHQLYAKVDSNDIFNRRFPGKTIIKRTQTFVIANKVIQNILLSFWGARLSRHLDFNFNSSRDFYLHNLSARSLRAHILQFNLLNSSVLLMNFVSDLFLAQFRNSETFISHVTQALSFEISKCL
jgi:hypothetical protein